MTIAACYVTPEGVVLGADSTASAMLAPGGYHYFNYNQKLFEIGDPGLGSLAAVTWGMGGLGGHSYRTLLALLNDDLQSNPAASVADVANRRVDLFWTHYFPLLGRVTQLQAKQPFDPSSIPSDPNARTDAEEEEFQHLARALFVGFCLGGYVMPTRAPEAFVIGFDPLQGEADADPNSIRVMGILGGSEHDTTTDFWL